MNRLKHRPRPPARAASMAALMGEPLRRDTLDHSVLALLIPILALATGFVVVLKLPSKMFTPRPDPRLGALEEEVHRLRHELADAHERLDCAERLLTQANPSRPHETGG